MKVARQFIAWKRLQIRPSRRDGMIRLTQWPRDPRGSTTPGYHSHRTLRDGFSYYTVPDNKLPGYYHPVPVGRHKCMTLVFRPAGNNYYSAPLSSLSLASPNK